MQGGKQVEEEQSDVTFVVLQWDSDPKYMFKVWTMRNNFVTRFPIVPGYRGLLRRSTTGQREGALVIGIADRNEDAYELGRRYLQQCLKAGSENDQEVPEWKVEKLDDLECQVVPES